MRTVEAVQGDGRLDLIAGQLRFLVQEAEERRRLSQTYSELVGDLTPVASQGLATLSRLLAQAEGEGYVAFAKGGTRVIDRVVCSFDEDDLEALGDNIVLILDTVKEMTQPEVLQMLRATLHHVQEVDEPDEPPSMIALLRRLRTVEARRGLYRLVVALESLGMAAPQEQHERKEAHT